MSLQQKLQHKIDTKTKPLGALGQLEAIALQMGTIQNTLTPSINKPSLFVFAGDHGVVKHQPVSPFPQEVTSQMVFNFLNGGAAINVFCEQNNINLNVVDAGVNFDFEENPRLIPAKIAKGTQDYTVQKAMSIEQCELAVKKGKEIVTKVFSEGCNTIAFGEMGIGNTSAAALLMSHFTNTPIENCVGKGTGLNDEGVTTKIKILKSAQDFHTNINSNIEALATFGGFEIAMITGAFLQAKELNITVIVDGFIVSAALLAAHSIDKTVLDNCIFSHCSDENGHKKMLDFLGVNPLLNIGLRLGEGTGAALALPLIQSSVNFLNQMASFESAGVSTENK